MWATLRLDFIRAGSCSRQVAVTVKSDSGILMRGLKFKCFQKVVVHGFFVFSLAQTEVVFTRVTTIAK